MNKFRLLELADKKGYKSIGELSKAAKIPRSTFSAKINGHRRFDTIEVKNLCTLLAIEDNAVKVEIFLS